MLSLDKDINITSSAIFGAVCSDANTLYTANSVPEYRQYDWNGKQTNTTLALTGTPLAIALIGLASAVIITNSPRVSYIDIATQQKTDVTTNALATVVAGQQIASDKVNNFAISATSTQGKLLKINSNFTLTQLSPASLSGITSSCISFRSDTSTFLVGTGSSKILELDSSGTLITSVTLPRDPSISGPLIVVTGITYYNDNLIATTAHGFMYSYQWSTGALLRIYPISNRGSSNPSLSSLSDSASGTFILNQGGGQSPNSTTGITECFSASGNSIVFNTIMTEAVVCYQSAGIEPALSKIWSFTSSSSSNGIQLRTFNITSPVHTSEPVRARDGTPAADIPTRVIRLRFDQIGGALVEFDGNVPAGTIPVNCTDNHNYLELSEEAGSPLKWDLREFKA